MDPSLLDLLPSDLLPVIAYHTSEARDLFSLALSCRDFRAAVSTLQASDHASQYWQRLLNRDFAAAPKASESSWFDHYKSTTVAAARQRRRDRALLILRLRSEYQGVRAELGQVRASLREERTRENQLRQQADQLSTQLTLQAASRGKARLWLPTAVQTSYDRVLQSSLVEGNAEDLLRQVQQELAASRAAQRQLRATEARLAADCSERRARLEEAQAGLEVGGTSMEGAAASGQALNPAGGGPLGSSTAAAGGISGRLDRLPAPVAGTGPGRLAAPGGGGDNRGARAGRTLRSDKSDKSDRGASQPGPGPPGPVVEEGGGRRYSGPVIGAFLKKPGSGTGPAAAGMPGVSGATSSRPTGAGRGRGVAGGARARGPDAG